jgi:hypothetical protein
MGVDVTLELNKVMGQVDDLAREAASSISQASERLDEARGWLKKYAGRFKELKAQAEQFGAAIPTDEPLDATHPAPDMPARFTVIGADGSAIPPDRHSAAMYYLINSASLTYRHGSGEQPIATSIPQLGYTTGDLYEGRLPVQGNLLDVRRDTAELARLADAAQAEPGDVPLVALTDGTLLLWVLEESPEEQRRKVQAYVHHLAQLKNAGAAVGGFISRPRYPDVLRLVWLAQLGEHVSKQAMEDNPFLGLADRSLFDAGLRLAPGERSACFVSPSPVNKSYGEHQIGFFYVNVGDENQIEIARIETPEWVWRSPELLNRLHGAVMAQCRLVTPYPYVLARAHELAVVATDERRQLESFVEAALLRHGIRGQPSQKAFLKSLTGGAKRAFKK